MSVSTVASLGEHALIRRMTARLAAPPWVVIGPGDDAAVIAYERGTLEVLTTDALVDGVHFDRRFVAPASIGHRALAANLSDLAAMGAAPRAALLSLILPPALDVAVVDGLLDGMLALADLHRTFVVGGNITSTPGPLTVNITAIGSVRPRRILRRDGARPGDDVYVTGSLGGAAVGLRRLQERMRAAESVSGADAAGPAEANVTAFAPHREGSCEERYLQPQPRVRAGLLLGRNRVASSCMDLSDGLADGIRQIAAASNVGMTIDAAAVPIADDVREWHRAQGLDAVDGAMTGGDDFELLFTVRRAHRGRLAGVARQMSSLPVTRIGTVTRERALIVRDERGTRELPHGYEHFR